MADDDEKRLEEELARRWDPERLSRFLRARRGSAERLDLTTRQRYERRLGVDLGDVRIFTGELADEIATAHGAEALTVGSTGMVVLGGGARASMGTASGEALLAHELTHVAQTRPDTIQRKAVSDAPLATEASEAEAEAIEREVLHGLEARQPKPNAATDGGARERREKVVKRVVEMIEEERRFAAERSGRL
jgi:hypothetical protein